MTAASVVIIIVFIAGLAIGYKYGFKKGGYSFGNKSCWQVLLNDIKPKWLKLKK